MLTAPGPRPVAQSGPPKDRLRGGSGPPLASNPLVDRGLIRELRVVPFLQDPAARLEFGCEHVPLEFLACGIFEEAAAAAPPARLSIAASTTSSRMT